MIDPSIITRGAERAQMQQQQNFESLGELGNSIGRMVLGRRINTLQQLGTPEEKQAYANKSIYAPQLNAQIKADQAAALQAQMVQQKHASDISKTNSEAFKNNQQGSGFGLDNSGKLLAAANQALYVGTQSGDPNAVKLALNNAKTAGLLDEATYNQYFATVEGLSTNPEGLKSFALNLQKAYAQNPEKYNFTTADNVLTNQTSITNNELTNKTAQRGQDISAETSRYGTDVGAKTAADRLAQDGQQFAVAQDIERQKIAIQKSEGEIVTGADGMGYIFYKNRPSGDRYEPLLGTNGAHAKSPTTSSQKGMSATVQKELFQTEDAITAGSAVLTNLKDALKYSAGAYDGIAATTRAKAMGHFSDDESAKNTILLDNIMTGNALEALKAIFGAAPTEGERKILLDLQGATNLPRAQREAIYTRAITATERRLEINQQKAQGIKDGTYFKPSQLQQNQIPSSGAGSSTSSRPSLDSIFK